MPLRYANLDDRTRALMLDELDRDVADGTLFHSQRLNARGRECYAALLREAVQLHDDRWLAQRLERDGCLKQRETRHHLKAGLLDVAVPVTAATTIADGEFNAFYIRAVCRRASEDGSPAVQVYRARRVAGPRPESTAKVGAMVSAEKLLQDLRDSKGVESALGVPSGPNSSLSVMLPVRTAV